MASEDSEKKARGEDESVSENAPTETIEELRQDMYAQVRTRSATVHLFNGVLDEARNFQDRSIVRMGKIQREITGLTYTQTSHYVTAIAPVIEGNEVQRTFDVQQAWDETMMTRYMDVGQSIMGLLDEQWMDAVRLGQQIMSAAIQPPLGDSDS